MSGVQAYFTAGNVGIGTTNPQNALTVVGDINATGNIYSNGINLSALSTSGGINGSGTAWYIPMWNGTTSLNNSAIYQNGGNIGINITSSPEELFLGGMGNLGLNLSAVGVNGGGIRWYNAAGTAVDAIRAFTNGDLILATNGSEVMRILANGNVGIGTSGPGNLLTVLGNSSISTNYAFIECYLWINVSESKQQFSKDNRI